MRVLSLLVFACLSAASLAEPLSLHPENPHYFQFRSKPIVLIGASERYGAVLNSDFQFVRYLDTLAAAGLNFTRIFSGTYVESNESPQIAKNTLSPATGRLLTPWARSDKPGYAGGGSKFNLDEWDEAYFTRLKNFVAEAGKREIVVGIVLFSSVVEDAQWRLSPMNSANNVNNVGAISKDEVYDFDKNGALQALQENLVRKVVAELRGADNVYYEICNEPYAGAVSMDWQHRIADVIAEVAPEAGPLQLICQHEANGAEPVNRAHPGVSILSFHHAQPPEGIAVNYGLNRALGLYATGLKGATEEQYRQEAWEFLLAGGGLYQHLDYSFAVGHEDGTFDYPATQPGGGSASFRKQLQVLSRFLRGFEFLRMKPGGHLIKGTRPETTHLQILAEPGHQYALYCKSGPPVVRIELPAGAYRATWINAASGREVKAEQFTHTGGERDLTRPEDISEVALKIIADPQ